MSPIAKRCRIGDCPMEYDRISNLPAHLLSCILDRMPINDAARTSILSKTWKNIWLVRSHVVLRDTFVHQLVSKQDVKFHQSLISGAVNKILIAHRGPISEFCLFIPQHIDLQPYYDSWMSLVSTKGVKHLELNNVLSNPIAFLPSCIFSCSELARLLLARYKLDPPPNFEGFPNLTLVYLKHVEFGVDMSFGPQLNQLSLIQCFGIRHLARQFTHHNTNLKKIELVRWEGLEMWGAYYNNKEPIKECIFNLHRFLSCTPNMDTLILGSFCLFLDPEQTILTRLTTTMEKMKRLVLYDVKFHDLCHISNALCLIRSSPNLQTLKITVEAGGDPADFKAEQYLESPDCSRKLVLNQLHYVEIGEAVGSRVELLFVNLLRASSPSLQRLHWHKFFCQKLCHPFHINGL